MTAAKTNVTAIVGELNSMTSARNTAINERDGYSKALIFMIGFTSIPTIWYNSTTLILVNKASISVTTASLNQVTRAIIVGNYTPTGLIYSELKNLESLHMFAGTMTENVQDAISDLTKTEMKLKYLEIPQWGPSIKASAFAHTNEDKAKSVQELVGFEDVTTVGSYAFDYCAGLKSVSFPKLTTAGAYAFDNCSGLKSLSFPKLTYAGNWAFCYCTALESLSLPELTATGIGAFCYCGKLTTLNVPKLTVDKAGSYTFIGVPKSAIPPGFDIPKFTQW
ncbi:MAG: leucine-rich repeat domain-containing protein [Holosporales bacterium]|nr:leucine-rich repeat domain-containing protein [Holosporales bacterium]